VGHRNQAPIHAKPLTTTIEGLIGWRRCPAEVPLLVDSSRDTRLALTFTFGAEAAAAGAEAVGSVVDI